MKKYFFLVIFLMFTGSSSLMSAVFIVDNSNTSPGIFQTIQAAVNSANPGDTIYVQGSPTHYDFPNPLSKRVVLIGTGHQPNKQAPIISRFNPFTGITFGPGSSGTTLMGFYMDWTYIVQRGVDSLTISDNSIGNFSLSGQNHLIENNIIRANFDAVGNGVGMTQIIIRNNIFAGTISNFSEPTVEFTNNIFLSNTTLFTNVSNIVFKNNILLGSDPLGASGVTFLNNLTFQVITTIPYGTNTGSGNINNIDPEFVNVPANASAFSYTYDFHLQNTSPGINAGSDGTNIGVYGGLAPFKMGGEPPIPMVKELNISNSIVPLGTNIDINVVGETQQ